MALIKCSECGKQISDQATVCPHCGAGNNGYTYCTNCGAKCTNDNYCTNCGQSMNQYSQVTGYQGGTNSKNCGIALAGGITGICSLALDPFGVVSITAIILSAIGLNMSINGGLKGKGWAITGLVCGIIELVFKVIVIINYFS